MIPSCRLQNKSCNEDQSQLTAELKPMKLTMLVTTDLNGMTRGRSCPTVELENYLMNGCGWVPANSSLTPNDLISDENPWGCQGDLSLLPDRKSRVTLSHGPNPQFGSLDFIHCDLVETDGRCWSTCPRTFLRQEIQRYEDLLGLRVYASFEHEFTLTGRDSIDGLPGFSLRAQSHVSDFAGWLMGALKSAGVEPEMFLPEFGYHQYEITCRPCFGVDAADRAVNVREITRDIARQLGLHASFSPKTTVDGIGNGVHLHISFKDMQDQPVLYDKNREYDLSELGEHWISGVLEHLPALCALTAPTPVSYLRLRPQHWCSAYVCFGNRNREAALRICPTVSFNEKPVSHQFNLEFRPLDGTASPHLSLAAILVAGRLGIEQQRKSAIGINTDPYLLSEDERKIQNISLLPADLGTALRRLQCDQALMAILPKPLTETYLMMKQHELTSTASMSDERLCEHYRRLY